MPHGTVDAIFGETGDLILGSGLEGEAEAFGEAADRAFGRFGTAGDISNDRSRIYCIRFAGAEKFCPGQATELIGFLARVLESVIRGWMSLPE